MRLPPPTDEMRRASERLAQSIKETLALRATMNPVDRALEYADQRCSFVRGMVSHTPDFTNDPMVVLADEVRRLRRILETSQ